MIFGKKVLRMGRAFVTKQIEKYICECCGVEYDESEDARMCCDED
jgi:hypothetical protein